MSQGRTDMAPRASSTSTPAITNSSGGTQNVHEPSSSPQSASNTQLLQNFGDELRCPLCKEFLRDPALTKNCLHRFCSNCIHKQIAGGLKTCPTCNALLPKKEAFKADRNLAAIMTKLLAQQRKTSEQNAVETMLRDGVDINFHKRPRSSLKQPLSNGSSQGSSEQTTSTVQQPKQMFTPTNGTSSQAPPSKISRTTLENFIKTSPPWTSNTNETPSTSHGVMNGHLSNNNHSGLQRAKGLLPMLSKENSSASNTEEDSNKSAGACPPTNVEEENGLEQPSTSQTKSSQECNGSKVPHMRGFPLVMDLPNQIFLAQKQRLNKEVYVELVLWPDSSVRRQAGLPNCILSPRYVYVPLNATIAHLIEYLVVRAEVEAAWKDRKKYFIDITYLEDEPDKIKLSVDPTKNDIHCSYPERCSGDPYTLHINNSEDIYRIMLRIAHPFQPLSQQLTMAEIASSYHANYRKPLKVLYRFVKKNT